MQYTMDHYKRAKQEGFGGYWSMIESKHMYLLSRHKVQTLKHFEMCLPADFSATNQHGWVGPLFHLARPSVRSAPHFASSCLRIILGFTEPDPSGDEVELRPTQGRATHRPTDILVSLSQITSMEPQYYS